MAVAVIALSTSLSGSAPGGALTPSGDTGAQRGLPRVTGAVDSGAAVTDTHTSVRVTAAVAPELPSRTDPTVGAGTLRKTTSASESEVVSADVRGVRCKSARRGLEFYRGRQRDWITLRSRTHYSRALMSLGRAPRSCADARFLAQVAKRRSFAARQAYGRYVERRTLRDFPFCGECNAWFKAVNEVQRVFPGSKGWLLSCSTAEGGHGRWVGYGGQGYSTWLRDSDTVGGPLQFRYSTFKGMFRRAVDHVYAHGYRAPIFTSYTAAWRSALGQALAGGWARWSGNDDSHWSASFGRGC